MNYFFKFLSTLMLTVIAFIGLVNLNVLMDHEPSHQVSPKAFLSKFIFVEKHSADFETHKPIDFNNFNLSSMYRLSKNLKLARKDWCQHNSSICKDLLSYSLAKQDWKFSEKLVHGLCYDFDKCPLADFLNDVKAQPTIVNAQLNNFSEQKPLVALIDQILRKTNIPATGVICYYAEKNYHYKCHWKNQGLVFFMHKSIHEKAFSKCTEENSIMDCWIDSRLKMKSEENQLTKACTLDSSAACYEMGLNYLREGHRFLAKRYFEKSCLLKFSNACLILSSEYRKMGDNYSKEYFESKACLFDEKCGPLSRLPASVRK
jgi:hypothetical protein